MLIDVRARMRQRLPQLVGVATRFPLAVIAAVALAAYHVLDLHLNTDWDIEVRTVRVPLALATCFLWAVLATLAGEARGLEAAARLALGAAGWFVIALLFVAERGLDLQPVLLLAGLLLALTVAPFVRRGVHNAELWQFNHTLWAGALVAAVAAVLAGGGISAILESVRYLFGLALPWRIHDKVWAIAGFVVAPVYWLSLVPHDFQAAVPTGDPQDFVSRAIAVLVRFILVPILLAYAVILHAYAIKIGFDQALPKGRIGWLVLCYGTGMAATALAAYPSRDSSGAMVRAYSRSWPWLMPVPLLLLAIAVGVRLRQYGLTDHRYLVVLGALWLGSLVVSQGLRGRNADLRLITGPLAALALAASLGPWGVLGLPVREQASEMRTLLRTAGLLQDGRVKSGQPAPNLSRGDRERLASIIDYLNRNARLGMIEPLFEGDPRSPFAGTKGADIKRYDIALGDRVRERLGIGRTFGGTERRVVSYAGAAPVAVPVAAGATMVGPMTLHTRGSNSAERREIATATGPLRVQLGSSTLTIAAESGPLATFDLAALWGESGPIPKETDLKPMPAPPLVVERTSGSRRATLIITNVIGNPLEAGSVDVSHVTFWLLLEGP